MSKMENNIIKIMYMNDKIIQIFKKYDVKESNIDKYNETINKCIEYNDLKTYLCLKDIINQYMNGIHYKNGYSNVIGGEPGTAPYKSLITPQGVVSLLFKSMPEVFLKDIYNKRRLETIKKYQKIKDKNTIKKEIRSFKDNAELIGELYN